MSNEPLPIPATRSPIEIAKSLQNPDFQRLFKVEVRKPGAWADEQPYLKQKLGPLGSILPLHVTPEARKSQYLVRSDVLLMAEGFLPPNTPEFALAQQTMAELVISQRPDVVLWTLKYFYPNDPVFQKISKGAELAAAIQGGHISLPPDYRQKVDILKQFDEFEAVGDPSQPDRKQTPLIPIVAEVAKAIRETIPQVPSQPQKKDAKPAQLISLPTSHPDTPARDALQIILNSDILTVEQKAESKIAYEQAVEKVMGKIPAESYQPKELPSEKKKIGITEESQKDTLAHAEDPGYGRNKQYGLITLTDAYFGGALGLFSESMQIVAEKQLEPLPHAHLHDRAVGIHILSENKKENVALREQLRKVLTSDCTFGYEYIDSESSYHTRHDYQRIISDLPTFTKEDDSFIKGKSRGLFINIPALRGQMEEVRKVIQALKKADGDYFDVLDQELAQFINGQFLKETDVMASQIGENYKKRYREQVTSTLTNNSPEKNILYPGVEALQHKLEGAIKNAPTYGYSEKGEYMSKIIAALDDPSKSFQEKEIQDDLERARKVMEGVAPSYDEKNWQKTSLISAEKTKGDKSLGDEILASAKKNKKEFTALEHTLQSLAFIYDMAELESAIPEKHKSKTPLWEPQPHGISLKKATNPYAVLRMVMAGGKPLTDFTESDQWTSPVSLRGGGWPPEDQARVQRDFETHKKDLKKAFEAITPIDMEMTKDRPIILIVGNNGSGKTFGMETAIQGIGFAVRTGIQPFAEQQKVVYTPVVRAMINASRHQERVSSFQGEIDLIVSVIEDIKGRDKNSCAVWAIDEIGKGTDSRDALALLFGSIEWARRHNVHFVVSTHYGRQFMELAQMLGIDGSIQIYNPNAETHELMPNTEVTASHGVEVMEKMGQKNDIPPKLLKALAENARRVRAIHDNRDSAKLDPIETGGASQSIQFAHEEDLADIGLSTTNRETGESGNYQMRRMADRQWVIPKVLLGENTDTYSDNQLKTCASNVRSKWSSEFQRNFANRDLTPEQITIRKGHISEMVELIGNNPDTLPEGSMSQKLYIAAIGKNALEKSINSSTLTDAQKRISNFFDKDDPLKESFSLYNDGGKKEFELFTMIALPSRIAEAQKAAQEVRVFLSQEGAPPHLKELGDRIGLTDRLGQYFIENDLLPSAELSLRYNGAIAKHILTEVRSTLSPGSYSTDHFLKYVPQMNELYGREFSKSADVFVYISEQVKNGDLTVLFKLNTWIQSQDVPTDSWTSSPLKTIKNSLNFFSDIQAGMVTRLSGNQEALIAAQTILGNQTDSPEGIAQKMQDAFIKGDCTLLNQLLTIPNLDSKMSYSYSEDSLKRLKRITTAVSAEKWIKWQEKLAEIKRNSNSYTVDYYSTLKINTRANSEQIAVALVVARKEKVIPEEELRAAEKLLLSPERLAYDISISEKALSEAQFLFTISKAIQKHKMCVPEHSEDGVLDVKKGINISLVDSLGSSYIPQSLHVDADINTVVIGGMNGGGKSQTLITLADIMTWDHFIGYVPAEKATLPKADFIVSAINAGESIVGMSSFQNEITRYLKVLDRYIEAGSPKNGVVFLDEPLAGTSSEDQSGILVSIIDFLQSRGVKVIMTNHNHAFFDVIRRTAGSTGDPIKFLPVAFGTEGSAQYQLEYFKQDETDKIKSRGIDVAEERGVEPEIIEVARHVRKLIDQIEEIKGNAKV